MESMDDHKDAMELFPHTVECDRKMRGARLAGDAKLSCTCPASLRRRNYTYLIERARMLAYTDALAAVRYRAKRRAEMAPSPERRQAFEEIATWAEALEVEYLNGLEKS